VTATDLLRLCTVYGGSSLERQHRKLSANAQAMAWVALPAYGSW